MPKILQRTGAMVVATCLSMAACQASDSANNEPAKDIFSRRGGVLVGVVTDEPGFAELKPGGNEREGFDVDLARWLGDHVPPIFTPILVDLTIDTRERQLRETVQLIVATYSITDKRRKLVGFAGPYMYSKQGIMV